METQEVLDALGVNLEQGLDRTEVARRRSESGPNTLVRSENRRSLRTFLDQLTQPLLLMLLGAALLSILLDAPIQAVLLLAAAILDVVLGLLWRRRDKNLAGAIRRLTATPVNVRREGEWLTIPSEELVPGDVVRFEGGDTISADIRLIETANLRVQQNLLTGRSSVTEKVPQPIRQADKPLEDRQNMVYMGSQALYGRGLGLVVESGMRTELGRLAHLIQQLGGQTPVLRRWAEEPGKVTGTAALIAIGLAAGLGSLRGENFTGLLRQSAALLAAGTPVALPFLVTILLLFGARRLRERNTLVQHLAALDRLGAVSVICSDKQGTLTEKQVQMTWMDLAGRTLELSPAPDAPGPLGHANPAQHIEFALLLGGGVLCNNASLERSELGTGDLIARGEAVESAILMAGAQLGLSKSRLDRLMPRILEAPFSSGRQRMSTVHIARLTPSLSDSEKIIADRFAGNPYLVITRGSLNHLLEVCDRVWLDGQVTPLTPERREEIRSASDRLTGQGRMVLGIAYRPLLTMQPFRGVAWSAFNEIPREIRRHLTRGPRDVPRNEEAAEYLEKELILAGWVGVLDPPREAVLPALQLCHQAGIRPVMITSDPPEAALLTAEMLHLANGNAARVLTGQEVSQMSQTELGGRVEDVSVFASVSAQHKLNIVQAYQSRGHIVAVTGTGLEDAPALRQSHIGLASGQAGDEITREAAHLVILDDSFATIVRAIEVGRRILAGLGGLAVFLLAGSLAEALVVISAPLAGIPVPWSPLQLLWVNGVILLVSGLGLSVRLPEYDVMLEPPVRPWESLFARGQGRRLIWQGLVMGFANLGLLILLYRAANPAWAATGLTHQAAMMVLFALLLRGRSARKGWRDPAALGAAALALIIQVASVSFPAAGLFGFISIQPVDLVLALTASLVSLVWLLIDRRF